MIKDSRNDATTHTFLLSFSYYIVQTPYINSRCFPCLHIKIGHWKANRKSTFYCHPPIPPALCCRHLVFHVLPMLSSTSTIKTETNPYDSSTKYVLSLMILVKCAAYLPHGTLHAYPQAICLPVSHLCEPCEAAACTDGSALYLRQC